MSKTSGSDINNDEFLLANSETPERPVASKYRDILSSNGNNELVAPTSAPIMQIVPFPVQEIEEVPGPKYSTI